MAEYAGLSLIEALRLDIFSFWALLRDAVVYNHSQSKQGREWLRNAHRLTLTEPDEDALWAKFGKGANPIGDKIH